MKGRISIAVVVVLGLALSACGDEDIHYSDEEIIKKLHLEESGDDYAIDGDPFCTVEGKLLNDRDEVEEAVGGRNGKLVIASREANVGVKGLPGIVPDCQHTARKRLNRLDPPPKD